jgi:hypothetical protein
MDRMMDEPVLDVDCTAIAVDQNAVRDFLTFYVDNPDARDELGTPASLRWVSARR